MSLFKSYLPPPLPPSLSNHHQETSFFKHKIWPSQRTTPTTTKTRRLTVMVSRRLLLTSTVLPRAWMPSSFVTNVSPRRVLKRFLLLPRPKNTNKIFSPVQI